MSDIMFVKGTDGNVTIRVVNNQGSVLSLTGDAVPDVIVAAGGEGTYFHRMEVAKWDKGARGLHELPGSSAEEILRYLADHLGYAVVSPEELADQLDAV